MRTLIKLLIAMALCCLLAPSGWGHGVDGYVSPEQGYLIAAMYDDGEPMSYAAVEIKTSDSDLPFQKGRTDRNGLMMFKPDKPGLWQVEVTDGMGHRLALDVDVPAPDPEPTRQTPPDTASPDQALSNQAPLEKEPSNTTPLETTPAKPLKSSRRSVNNIVTGLAVIFGLFGLFYGWKGRRVAHGGQA